jgi:hypothetical protein
VSAGGHILQVTAVGYRGSRQQVAVAAGTTKTIVVWPGPPLEATELALATEDDRADERARAAQSRARTLRTIGWVGLGAGVASLWVGSVTGVLAIDRESLRADNCDPSNACNRVGYDAAQSGSTLALVSTVTLAAGALATAAGVWLILSNPTAAPSGETPLARNPLARSTVAAIPLPSGAAAAFVHRF